MSTESMLMLGSLQSIITLKQAFAASGARVAGGRRCSGTPQAPTYFAAAATWALPFSRQRRSSSTPTGRNPKTIMAEAAARLFIRDHGGFETNMPQILLDEHGTRYIENKFVQAFKDCWALRYDVATRPSTGRLCPPVHVSAPFLPPPLTLVPVAPSQTEPVAATAATAATAAHPVSSTADCIAKYLNICRTEQLMAGESFTLMQFEDHKVPVQLTVRPQGASRVASFVPCCGPFRSRSAR